MAAYPLSARTLLFQIPLNVSALLFVWTLLTVRDRYFVQPAFDSMDRGTAAIAANLSEREQRQFPQGMSHDFRKILANGELTSYVSRTCTVGTGEYAARVPCQQVAVNFFAFLGVDPLAGGVVQRESEWQEARRSVAIAHSFWVKHFGKSQRAIGSRLVVDGVPLEVAAVLPETFKGIDKGFAAGVYVLDKEEPMGLRYFLVKGQSISVSQAAFREVVQRYGLCLEDRQKCEITLKPAWSGWGDLPAEKHRSTSDAVLAVAVLFLALALSGTLSSETARALHSSRELLTRVYLGATPKQLITPMLGRAALMAAATVVISGIGFRIGFSKFMNWLDPGNEGILSGPPSIPELTVLCAGCWALLTLAIALPHLLQALRLWRGNRPNRGTGRSGVEFALLFGQVVVLVVLGVNLVHASAELRAVSWAEFGMKLDRCWSWTVDTQPLKERAGAERAPEYYRRSLQSLSLLPHVEAATLSISGAFEARKLFSAVWTEGDPTGKQVEFLVVGPKFFSTLRQQILWGREFSDEDHMRSTKVAVVNRTFADRIIPGNRRNDFRFRFASSDGASFRVVGAVADGKHNGIADSPVPTVYIPIYQWPEYEEIELIARLTDGNTVPPARGDIERALGRVMVPSPFSLEERYELAVHPTKVLYWMSVGISLTGYAILLWALQSAFARILELREKEVAIRMALGGKPLRVVCEECRGILGWFLSGASAGLLIAVVLTSKGYAWKLFAERDIVVACAVSLVLVGAPLLVSGGLVLWTVRRKELRACISGAG